MSYNNELIAKTEAYADRINDMQCAFGRLEIDHPEACDNDVEEVRLQLDKARSEVYIKVDDNDFIRYEELLAEANKLLEKTSTILNDRQK